MYYNEATASRAVRGTFAEDELPLYEPPINNPGPHETDIPLLAYAPRLLRPATSLQPHHARCGAAVCLSCVWVLIEQLSFFSWRDNSLDFLSSSI